VTREASRSAGLSSRRIDLNLVVCTLSEEISRFRSTFYRKQEWNGAKNHALRLERALALIGCRLTPIDPGRRFETTRDASRRSAYCLNLRYRVDHVQSHLHAAVSVIGPRLRKTGNAIVTISEELYPEAMVLGGQPVESAEYPGMNSRFGIRFIRA